MVNIFFDISLYAIDVVDRACVCCRIRVLIKDI